MTIKEFKKYFNNIEDMIISAKKKQEAIEVLCSDGYPLYDSDYITNYIELLAFAVGDESDWIMWYVYENKLGTAGLTAGFNDKLKKVDTVEKLYKIITTKI
jgi:hypothetical protein